MRFTWVFQCYSKIKSWFKKDKVPEKRSCATLLNKLAVIESGCKEGNYTSHNLELLIEIAHIIPQSPSIDLFTDKGTEVCFLSTTSQGLLEAVSKKYYAKQTIVRSHLISTVPRILPLNEWWSNDESITFFIIFMKEMIEIQYILIEEKGGMVEIEKVNFLDSYLFRLLVSDYIDLLKLLLMECTKNENEK